MPHIDLINPDHADGEADKLFKTAIQYFGSVPEPLQLFANNPLVANHVFNGFGPSMAQSNLSQPFFAWIRYLLASHTSCRHCIDVNGVMLMDMGVSHDKLDAARQDVSTVDLEEREKALLVACIKVVRDQQLLEKEDIDDLKKLGHSDADLITAFHHAAHSHAVDMMINAFGL
ncbi:MAG: hypothetical protein HQL70_06245 [Magnetococcales bacterium]|nr:hypothetical protein [Magnetococcales bacterium]